MEAKVDAEERLKMVVTVLRELVQMGQPKIPTSALVALLGNLDALEIAERSNGRIEVMEPTDENIIREFKRRFENGKCRICGEEPDPKLPPLERAVWYAEHDHSED